MLSVMFPPLDRSGFRYYFHSIFGVSLPQAPSPSLIFDLNVKERQRASPFGLASLKGRISMDWRQGFMLAALVVDVVLIVAAILYSASIFYILSLAFIAMALYYASGHFQDCRVHSYFQKAVQVFMNQNVLLKAQVDRLEGATTRLMQSGEELLKKVEKAFVVQDDKVRALLQEVGASSVQQEARSTDQFQRLETLIGNLTTLANTEEFNRRLDALTAQTEALETQANRFKEQNDRLKETRERLDRAERSISQHTAVQHQALLSMTPLKNTHRNKPTTEEIL